MSCPERSPIRGDLKPSLRTSGRESTTHQRWAFSMHAEDIVQCIAHVTSAALAVVTSTGTVLYKRHIVSTSYRFISHLREGGNGRDKGKGKSELHGCCFSMYIYLKGTSRLGGYISYLEGRGRRATSEGRGGVSRRTKRLTTLPSTS